MVRLTAEGVMNLEKELEYLKTIRMAEVSEEIKEARAHGDLSENAEYDAAKTEQARVEGRINDIEAMLRDVELIDEENLDTNSVNIGTTVRILALANNMEFEYQIVGTAEANINNGRISNESPVGAALIGHVVGDTIEVNVPGGLMSYKVLEIKK